MKRRDKCDKLRNKKMQQIRRLLIIEKNEDVLNILRDQIELTGEFKIHTSKDALGASDIIKTQNIEIILFSHSEDIEKTLHRCNQWRKENINIPIIIITNMQNDAEAIRLLEAGVNDYIAKPFRMTLLVARLRAHLRQFDRSSDAVLTIGPYWFRQDATLLIDKESGDQIRLTEKEAAILKRLYHAFPTVISRKKLLDDVWGYRDNLSTHTLETHIYRLRQKIESDPRKASLLITENRGYRLNL